MAFARTPPLCETCGHRNWDRRVPRMCLVDPNAVHARTCRDYERAVGSDDDF